MQNLYADGHEIASHTITHSHGTNFNEEKWANEVIGEAELLVRYGGVSPKDIKGMRAPFLAVGGDTMFRTLNRFVCSVLMLELNLFRRLNLGAVVAKSLSYRYPGSGF